MPHWHQIHVIFMIYALLSRFFFVAIYALFPQIFWDWKSESADFYTFRMYACSRDQPVQSLQALLTADHRAVIPCFHIVLFSWFSLHSMFSFRQTFPLQLELRAFNAFRFLSIQTFPTLLQRITSIKPLRLLLPHWKQSEKQFLSIQTFLQRLPVTKVSQSLHRLLAKLKQTER